MTKLYFLAYENDDGEDMDLFITADSPQAAVLMFRAEWADLLDMDDLSRPLQIGPVPAAHTYEALRVFSVNPDPDCAGVLSWHTLAVGHHGVVTLEGWTY